MKAEHLSTSRLRRASASATAAKINASLKAEAGAIKEPTEQPPAKKTGKRPASAVPPAPGKKSKGKASAASVDLTTSPPHRPKEDSGDTLLGHFISKCAHRITPLPSRASAPPQRTGLVRSAARCVGIQHYSGNGARYSKEPLHLTRDPKNRYDCNAIAVRTVGGKQVGTSIDIL